MKNHHPLILAIVCAVPLAQTDASVLIIEDKFSGSLTSDIEGRIPDTVQSVGDAWSRDNADSSRTEVGGGILYMSETTKGFSKAALEFDRTIGLVASNPYTLSFSIAFNPGTDTNVTWYGGFGNSPGNGGTFSDNIGSLSFRIGGIDTTGTSFALGAGFWTGAFAFTNSFTPTISRATTSDLYSVDLAIRVDPLAISNNVEYFVNGASLGTITYSGTIGGLWFKTDSWDNTTATGMRMSNFQLTAIPEPSLGLLLGVGMFMLLGVVRRVRGKA
jgi:hypothetical protein